MPAKRILVCEPNGPLGTLIPRGPLCFWGGAPGGESIISELRPLSLQQGPKAADAYLLWSVLTRVLGDLLIVAMRCEGFG